MDYIDTWEKFLMPCVMPRGNRNPMEVLCIFNIIPVVDLMERGQNSGKRYRRNYAML